MTNYKYNTCIDTFAINFDLGRQYLYISDGFAPWIRKAREIE